MVNSVTTLRAGSRFGIFAAAAAAVAMLVVPAQAQTFNAASQFSTTNGNPNGVWAYGFSSGATGAFSLYNTPGTVNLNGSTFRTFRTTTSSNPVVPFIGVNDGPATLGVATGQLAFHTGPDAADTNSVLRFIAPSLGSYALTSQFFVGDTGETDLTIFLNGAAATPLFSSAVTSTNPVFNTTLILNAGDIVSFSVGVAGQGSSAFFNDTTPANVQFVRSNVAATAPEPGTLALLIPAGLGVVGIVRRRRK